MERQGNTDAAGTAGTPPPIASPDQDIHKGAVEDDHPSAKTNAPGLDKNGLPNDTNKIAEAAIAARADCTQG